MPSKPHAAASDEGKQSFGPMVTTVPAVSEVFRFLRRLAPTDLTLTVMGETGTGKGVVARAIHNASARKAGPFFVFDCGAASPTTTETELFGRERGAFGGAHADHSGAFEKARGGTLFLDEIGDLPLGLQPGLLRALERRSIRRIGGSRDIRLDLRIIATTNRNLRTLVADRLFREDLYFRLASAVVDLPPLRERGGDLPLLVQNLFADLGRAEVKASAETFAFLRAHSWPGNIRELKNMLACALTLVDAGVLEPWHLRFMESCGDHSLVDRAPASGQTLAGVEQPVIKSTPHRR